jgi:EmrB/QacA subfamily drug resistance transporter
MLHDARALSSFAADAHARNRLTLPVLCGAVLIAQIDSSVANLATKPIGEDFGADIGALQWVIDSYNLVYASLLLTGGLLADLLGRRRVFVAGAALFTLASLVCAAAPAISILIAGRALTGLGSALILPASLAIVRVVWSDPAERGRALGVWTGCNGVGLAFGPTLGGALIHGFGWRAVFLIVVPLGVAACALAPAAFAESADPDERDFDWPAQAAGALALGALALAAIESHRDGAVAAAALAVAVAALMGFIRIEAKRGAKALVPLPMFAVRAFRGAATATAGMTFGMYGMLFLLPLFWLTRGTLGPAAAGFALMPSAAVYIATSPFSGLLAERIGARLMMSGGVAIIGCGLILVGATADATGIMGAEAGLALTGLGMGLATGPLMGTAVAAVPAARSGTAASLINVARMAGATVGVAVLGAVFAIAGGGSFGLRLAMLVGGSLQLVAAASAWTTTRADRPAPSAAGRRCAMRPSPAPGAPPARRAGSSQCRRRSRRSSRSATPAPRRSVRAKQSPPDWASSEASPRQRWCRGRSKLRASMEVSAFVDSSFQVNVAAKVVRQARVERGSRLAAGLADFVSFERALHDVGDGPMFAPRKAAGQVASLGATYGELRFGHAWNLQFNIYHSMMSYRCQDGNWLAICLHWLADVPWHGPRGAVSCRPPFPIATQSRYRPATLGRRVRCAEFAPCPSPKDRRRCRAYVE